MEQDSEATTPVKPQSKLEILRSRLIGHLSPQATRQLLAIGIFLLVASTVYLYSVYAGLRNLNEAAQLNNVAQGSSSATPATPLTEDQIQTQYQKLIAGNTSSKLIKRDLELLTKDSYVLGQDGTYGTGCGNMPIYYKAAVLTAGKYRGYDAILATTQYCTGGGGVFSSLFVTKDYKTYVLDLAPTPFTGLALSDQENPMSNYDPSKVTSFEDITSTIFPKIIALDNNHSLLRESYAVSTTKTDNGSNYSYTGDVGSATQVSAPIVGLKFYLSYGLSDPYYSSPTDQTQRNYLQGYEELTVVDASGLVMTYTFGRTSDINDYLNKFQAYNQSNYDNYTKKTTTLVNYPDYPAYQLKPGFSGSYQTYSGPFPQACLTSPAPMLVKNISDSDLQSLGSADGYSWYSFKDPNYPLIKAQYDAKITKFYGKDSGTTYSELNKGSKPTVSDYAAKYPLLLTKDYWGNWMMVGEYDILLPGGCGKPVVYIYPTKPTTVSVKLLNPTQFTTDIPSYHNGWKVLAHPDGSLTDLQPQFTDCSKITLKFGSAYAASACSSQTYPYLYWSGNVLGHSYPKLTSGWVVTATDLRQVLDNKLASIGLNDRERSDMLSFWVPAILSKGAPYYRISLLQNEVLNYLIPMQINPTPDSVIRVFLDWEPLSSPVNILAETLHHYSRRGFTVVEWGGLKR